MPRRRSCASSAAVLVAAQENSPEMLNIVDVFPHTIAGPPDANQSAAQPCFYSTPALPRSP